MERVIIVNLKTYAEASGENALKISKISEEVARETGRKIIVAPPMPDLALVASSVSIPIFSQHVDNVKPGNTTGFAPPEAIKAAGAAGTLINHSEHRLIHADIDELIKRCGSLDLVTVVCTNNISVSKAAAIHSPDFVAVEPPELIGGNVSVTDANPEIVSGTVSAIRSVAKDVGILTGAGVKNGRDVAKAIELGTDGVLLASGVAKAKDPKVVLLDLCSGIPD
ncbi:MAG: triose-phosphate isomerase [Thermoplasmata archaeon]|nr:triose-phosphate isomerase [Thermoplasmata archaeon]